MNVDREQLYGDNIATPAEWGSVLCAGLAHHTLRASHQPWERVLHAPDNCIYGRRNNTWYVHQDPFMRAFSTVPLQYAINYKLHART